MQTQVRQTLQLRPIDGNPEELRNLQRVLESAPDYALKVLGHKQRPDAAQSLYTILPPGIGYGDKFVFGLHLEEEMIGCVDLIRGYPEETTAMLGLLLLSESRQKLGLGREAFQLVEKLLRRWSKTEKIRLAILETNIGARPFWEKMGFRDTGDRKPYQHGSVNSELLVFEKPLATEKSRYTMSASLSTVALSEKWPTSAVSKENAEALGFLMASAYRGSVDDEGEGLRQYLTETRATLEGRWGDFIHNASFAINVEEKPVAATLITLWKGRPLIAQAVTAPEHRGRGMARYLIRKSMNALTALGYDSVVLGVTAGNAAAEHLYRQLGFTVAR